MISEHYIEPFRVASEYPHSLFINRPISERYRRESRRDWAEAIEGRPGRTRPPGRLVIGETNCRVIFARHRQRSTPFCFRIVRGRNHPGLDTPAPINGMDGWAPSAAVSIERAGLYVEMPIPPGKF
jgi:hypothetical protein